MTCDNEKEVFSDDEFLNSDKINKSSRQSLFVSPSHQRNNSSRSPSSKKKDDTKLLNFNFLKPGTHLKKHHPASSLISSFFSQNFDSIYSKSVKSQKASLSRKILNKIINSTYMSCISKIKNGETINALAEQVYDDFYQKYGLKAVSEKRFLELISSLFNFVEYRRILVFIKFLGCGSKINKKNYSSLSFIYYLNALLYMLNSKIGVVVFFDELSDQQMFPLSRGIECIREKLELIVSPNTLAVVLNDLQIHSENDSKGLNPAGLIELEIVLETIVEHYESYQESIENGIDTLLKALGCEDFIESYDFLIAIRHISFDRLEFSDVENIAEITKKVNFSQLVKEIENTQKILKKELLSKCIENNLLKIEDVQNFCQPEKISTLKILEDINSNKEIYESIAKEIDNNGKKIRTLDGKEFLNRISRIVEKIEEKNPYLSLLAWKIYKNELQRIKPEYF